MLAACVGVRAAAAMELGLAGDQMVLSGPVLRGDFERIERLLTEAPAVTTVILRNSPGGDATTGYEVGAMFRRKALRTVVSGYCYSSCSRMFLGGVSRVFSDDFAAEATQIGLHGHYDRQGALAPILVEQLGLRDWIIRYSDGRADPALVERWIAIPASQGMIRFFHPERVVRHGVSTFMCQGPAPAGTTVFDCEPIARTALELGIVTSLDIFHSRDAAAARLALRRQRAPSGYADIDDVARLPLLAARGRDEYARFLGARGPRAFAVAHDRMHWAWNSGNPEPAMMALMRCADRSGQACELYAVDDTVIWDGSDPPPKP